MRYHHGNLRSALLSAALETLDERGCEAVTIRSVARDAGVSHAAPANHFEDRRALLTALAASIFAGLRDDIELRLEDASLSATGRLAVFARCLYGLGLDYPYRYELLWRHDLIDRDSPMLTEVMDGIYERLVAELRSAANSSVDRDYETPATALWSLTHGYVSMRHNGVFVEKRDASNGRKRFETMLDMLLASFASADARPDH